MKLLRKKIGALKGLALAGILGTMSAGQHAQAVFVFSILDSDTFTITASGSSLNGSNFYVWGPSGGTNNPFLVTSLTPGAAIPTGGTPANGQIFKTAGLDSPVTGFNLTDGFGSGGFVLPDGGVYTFSDGVADLTTLVLPPSPLSLVTGSASGADNSLVFVEFVAVPEPSGSICLGVGFCSLLLRRKRA